MISSGMFARTEYCKSETTRVSVAVPAAVFCSGVRVTVLPDAVA